MRTKLLLVPLIVLLMGCPSTPPDDTGQVPDDLSKRSEGLKVEPIDIDLEIVQVREIERRNLPDDIAWPGYPGIMGGSAWYIRDGEPVIVAADQCFSLDPSVDTGALDPKTYAYYWDTGETVVHELDRGGSTRAGYPIAYISDDGTEPGFGLLTMDMDSENQSVRFENAPPIPLPVIDRILHLNLDGEITGTIEIDTSTYELSVYQMLFPLDHAGFSSITCQNYVPINVESSPGNYSIIMPWAKLDLETREITELQDFATLSGRSGVDGYLENPGLFFQAHESRDGEDPYTWVYSMDGSYMKLPGVQKDENVDEMVPMRISDYISAVHYQDRHIVFAVQSMVEGVETSDDPQGYQIYVIAISFTGDELIQSDPSIIWSSVVPNIFMMHTVIYTGEDRRPYVVCLDRENGDLTVLDPVTGTIRTQMNVGMAEHEPGTGAILICRSMDSADEGGDIFLLDPVSGEIIRLEIETHHPSLE